MAKITLKDPKGDVRSIEAVDAHEYVTHAGWTASNSEYGAGAEPTPPPQWQQDLRDLSATWRNDLHHMQKKKLARHISGTLILTVSNAERIIAAALEAIQSDTATHNNGDD